MVESKCFLGGYLVPGAGEAKGMVCERSVEELWRSEKLGWLYDVLEELISLSFISAPPCMWTPEKWDLWSL